VLYDRLLMVNNGKVTEGKPLDAARVALVRDRIGRVLLEQPGAFDDYDTEVQHVTPRMWWNKKKKRIGNPILLAWLARHWPSQPLSGRLGAYYEVSIAAWAIAQRRPSLRSGPVARQNQRRS